MPCHSNYTTKDGIALSYERLKTHKRKKYHLGVITIYEMHFIIIIIIFNKKKPKVL